MDVIAAYPTLKGIFTMGSPNLPAAGQALEDLGIGDKIALVGGTTPNAVNDLVKSGVVNACLMWDPADAAYAAVYVMHALHNGTPEITDGMSMDFLLGPSAISLDGKVILANKPVKFTPDIIDKFDF